MNIFKDRTEAGRLLAMRLPELTAPDRPLVLAVPRGGVQVGLEIARHLKAPLDLLLTKKIGAPFNAELALGAVIGQGDAVLDDAMVSSLNINAEYIESQIGAVRAELERQSRVLRAGRTPLDIRDRTVIVTDDGVATGHTIEAALEGVRRQEPRRIILAVPVGPPETLERLRARAEVVCLLQPPVFLAVGQFYRNFRQLTDDDVVAMMTEGYALSTSQR